jgi:hypothetical protein
MADRFHRPFKVRAFNANGIWRRHEFSKQLQGLHIHMAVLSETHIKTHERFVIPNYHFHQTDRFPRRKGTPHNHVDLRYMFDTYISQR